LKNYETKKLSHAKHPPDKIKKLEEDIEWLKTELDKKKDK